MEQEEFLIMLIQVDPDVNRAKAGRTYWGIDPADAPTLDEQN